MPSNPIFTQTWHAAWSAYALPAPSELFQQLLAAYDQPQRHYHTRQHLQECLQHFVQTQHLAEQPAAVCLALWFHDAVYAMQAHDNEAQSATWAKTALIQHGISVDVADRVAALVMATEHHALPTDHDAQLLVDIDLAILAADHARFAEYEQQIQQEYAWVEPAVFVQKRREVLSGFLARPRIYQTAYFAQRYEQQARQNLQLAIG